MHIRSIHEISDFLFMSNGSLCNARGKEKHGSDGAVQGLRSFFIWITMLHFQEAQGWTGRALNVGAAKRHIS